ncbi:MAG: polysaccharide deacetylase family protein [Clostridia bacterium]|nr:polysaccharide deacetylase family protein [Clostridia bacterium]
MNHARNIRSAVRPSGSRHAFLLLLCALLLCLPCVCAAEGTEGFYTEMPYHLRVKQTTQSENVQHDVYVLRTYPDTANDEVDAQMRDLIDDMAERNRPYLPLERGEIPTYLDVGAVITRTGTSVMSFLTLAEVSKDKEQLHMDYAARVFDIADGRLLALTDLFDEDSGAWAYLAQEIRRQLSAAFPALEPDQEALERLCRPENIRHADFTLGAARLTLTYRADLLYPGKHTLLHVNVYYPDIREMMTPYAKEQTDNSRFRMVALTYDDGGARASTRRVLGELRAQGAQATFFVVGFCMAKNHEMLCRQQDCNYSIQSHTYNHDYPNELTPEIIFEEKQRYHDELTDLIGVAPTVMRAPGGMDDYYIKHQIGYPVIHWSLASGDSGNTNVKGIASRVMNGAKDGDVILMHDSNPRSSEYTRKILERFNQKGILCVTLEELFADAGVKLEANRIYFSPYRIDK